MLETPIIIINLKTYREASGKNAVGFAKIIEDVAVAEGANVALACLPTDINMLSRETSLPIFAQHIDAVGFGGFTGHILPEATKEAGAEGTLINHSERKLTLFEIEANIARAREVGLLTCVCTNNIAVSRAAAALKPDFLAVEPPELIGGDISISSAQPELVTGTVDAVREINRDVTILCGAGVKSGADIKKSLELGAAGVLLASGVVKAKDVEAVIKDLISGLK